MYYFSEHVEHPELIAAKMNFIHDVNSLNLAKYELVTHPYNPFRLTKISLLVKKLEALANAQNMMAFFDNNVNIVTQIINQIFLYQ